MYVPIHVHSTFSLLDGLPLPKNIVKRCQQIGVPACGITDHGSISGGINFYTHMKKAKLKPILGCEFYIGVGEKERKNEHLLIIAKNLAGWKELISLVSAANHPDNFYYKPRLTLDKLRQYINGNVIGIAGHIGSVLAEQNCTKERLEELQSIFGKENFFIEIQAIDRDYNSITQPNVDRLRELAALTGTQKVATPDAHYPAKEDAIDQRILLCNKLNTSLASITKKIVNEEDVGLSAFFKSSQYYIPTYEEMQELHTEDELKNTLLIADMCEDFQITHSPILPKYKTPNDIPSNQYLRELCREGWKNKLNQLQINSKEFGLTNSQYGERFEKEIQVLEEANLADYFLIVKDIIDYAKSINCICGPGRGSAAGSLILYLLDVTKVDPLAYGLYFERFFNRGRSQPPQISFEEFSYAKFVNSQLPDV